MKIKNAGGKQHSMYIPWTYQFPLRAKS